VAISQIKQNTDDRIMPECQKTGRLHADHFQSPCAECSLDPHAIHFLYNSCWFQPINNTKTEVTCSTNSWFANSQTWL